MSIIDDAKDMARKATNSIVDTAQNVVDKPKSPKEIAKRLIEHLNHQEYAEIAEILSDEAKKYAKHLGIKDFPLVESKLNDFKYSMKDVASNMEEGNYNQVANKLKEIEGAIPESIAGVTEIPTSIKTLLKDMTKVMEDYDQENTRSHHEGSKPDFSKLQEVFEGYFTKMISNNKQDNNEQAE